jgi:hypothetical protein
LPFSSTSTTSRSASNPPSAASSTSASCSRRSRSAARSSPKIAYSDWKRVGDYSRLLTQHADPDGAAQHDAGGDKNGADITMALDALEMAFTHDHINAFVIVGGDSDFISLVEKLKQYGRKVIVVGGRQFTSATMQRNCHEFIAYENLRREPRRPTGGTLGWPRRPARHERNREGAAAREARAQGSLGARGHAAARLLKSTLLQLDSTFSEREYGVSSFRDFMEKVAKAGAVTLKHAGRSMLVESIEDGSSLSAADGDRRGVLTADPSRDSDSQSPIPVPAPRSPHPDADDEEQLPASPMSLQDGIRAVQHAFTTTPPRAGRFYVRQAKQHLRTAIDGSTSGATDSRPWSICSAPRERGCASDRTRSPGAIR